MILIIIIAIILAGYAWTKYLLIKDDFEYQLQENRKMLDVSVGGNIELDLFDEDLVPQRMTLKRVE